MHVNLKGNCGRLYKGPCTASLPQGSARTKGSRRHTHPTLDIKKRVQKGRAPEKRIKLYRLRSKNILQKVKRRWKAATETKMGGRDRQHVRNTTKTRFRTKRGVERMKRNEGFSVCVLNIRGINETSKRILVEK